MKQKQTDTIKKLKKFIRAGILLVLMLIPLHAPITVWLGSLGFNYEIVRLWKEIVLLLLALACLFLMWQDRKLYKSVVTDQIVLLTAGFLLIVTISALVTLMFGFVSPKAIGYGLIVDTRMLVFLLVCTIAIKAKLHLAIPRLIIIPAILVVGFGLLQMSVLNSDFLGHFGYGPETIQSYQAVDNNPDFPRTQSTLRGPNPLGAYLIPVIMLLIIGVKKFNKFKWQFVVGVVATLTVLFGTYSRSAWIGAGFAIGLYFGWRMRHKLSTYWVAGAIVLILASFGGVYILRNNDVIQNLVFHSSEKSTSDISSNAQRANALNDGIYDVLTEPLGGGLGSAGPASYYNPGRYRISENFYIQIGQELGLLGLVLYLSVTTLIIVRLWELRRQAIVAAILAAFIGLIVVNIVSHAWSDDTLAYVMGALLAYGLFAYKASTKTEN